jgi:hypothetical protein
MNDSGNDRKSDDQLDGFGGADNNGTRGQVRDRALSGCWTLESFPDDWFDALGDGKDREARLFILGEAFVIASADPNQWISYSRRKESYVSPHRYRPKELTWTTVTRGIDALTDAGWLESETAFPGQRGQQSRFRLRPGVGAKMMAAGIEIAHHPAETIFLRDNDKRLIEYADNDETRRMRKNLQIINTALHRCPLQFDSKTVVTGEILRIGRAIVGPAHNDLHRVFNRASFGLGGRFYGGWWQNVPSERRGDIVIGGHPTLEEDYRALHPTLLYAESGKVMAGDPYELAGWERKLVKKGFNILLNADGDVSALKAIALEIKGDGAFAKAKQLVLEIGAKHNAIADQFCSGAGLRLQRVDSGMAERVILDMILKGIICLPIHDSFIVDAAKLPALKEKMAEVLETTVRRLGGTSVTSTGYSKSVPQYGEGWGDGARGHAVPPVDAVRSNPVHLLVPSQSSRKPKPPANDNDERRAKPDAA